MNVGYLLTAAAFLAAAISIPAFGSEYTVQLATDILGFVALGYSWNLISGFAGYISFGQVSFFGLGAYTTAVLVNHFDIPWYVAVCCGGVVTAIVAAIFGPIMLRLRGILFALGMLGLARILTVVFSDWDYAGGAAGTTLPPQLNPSAVYIGMVLTALCAFAVNAYFARSGFGLDAMSVREDEDAAGALGVPTNKVKVITFILSAVFPGLVGGLIAWNRSYLDPASAFDPTLDLQTIVFTLFGGIGTLWGPLIGTSVLMLIGEQLLIHFSSLKLALYGAVVIATVLMFPGGLVSLLNRFGFLKRKLILAPSELPQGSVPAAIDPGLDAGASLLEVRDLSVRFGGLLALDNVSFKLRQGETLSIIGANGAGKTTLFNAITGFVPPSSGEILFRGGSVSALPVISRVRLGMARTFQIPRLLSELSVWENVVLAARHGRQKHQPVEHAAWVLRTVGLDEMWLEPVARLTPGRQRELELARVLALQPDLVFLDEVMAGMTKEEQERVRGIIRRMSDFGVVGIVCVEHVIAAIADLSDRMLVLDFGRKIADSSPAEVLNDPVVIKAYLGEVQ
ncbi:MAG TPA: branched-chain amino acid ABC transporter ATP-binding protein/permease [Nitrobacter sp.]|jgi:branched-chain amino acid transport system permease protein|nr:branched-chain amino acid ABC transporter ATP-binding protein/permease [Nitrobacter sp.]